MLLHRLTAAAAVVLLACSARTQVPASSIKQPTPGFNTKIPTKIMTPDSVETRIGTLKFRDGLPTDETVQACYDNLDFLRGVEVFLNFIPAASLESLRLGAAERGANKCNRVIITEQMLDSNPLFLTGNIDTVYCMVFLDLETDGPTVVEIPRGCGPGTVDDAFFRFVVDMGGPGPDQGQGGKYLIVPTWFKGELPKDKSEGGEYFIARSPSKVNLMALRGFLVDGKPEGPTKMFKEGLKVYPLSKAASPPPMEFINSSTVPFNTVHANDFEYFAEIDQVIQNEPLGFVDPELRGLAGSIGIVKGRPFVPDARMKKLLTEAVAVGNATARAISFRTRDASAYRYPNSQWKTSFVGNDYQWLNGDGMAGRNLDARAMFFYVATINTPAMARKILGRGSQYAFINSDKSGQYLDGAKDYRLNIPANVPAKDFWSVTLYDPQTRSELQTSQPLPGKNSRRDKLVANADGSIDLYYGPTAPAGKEANWTQTVPNKGWFALIRLYGPLEPWFDKTWQPGEVEPVK